VKISAICTDIDGTLLDSRRELSVRTIEAIKKLDKKIPVILASSRMPAAMRHLQRDLDILDHPLICYNGAYVIHHKSPASLAYRYDSVVIPAYLCEAIISLTHGTGIHVSLYNEDNWYARALDQWTEREAKITKVNPEVASFEEVLTTWKTKGTGAHKVMCMGPEHEMLKLAFELNEQYANEIHVYPSKSTYLEIAPRSISKASALESLLSKHYGIHMSEAMAFGDNYNDMELIQKVGWGVAVANARESVKAIAKEITLANIDDGVAVTIEKYADWYK
jgi:Cof subfamily protein (haloacid dehalogenase superfamily)